MFKISFSSHQRPSVALPVATATFVFFLYLSLYGQCGLPDTTWSSSSAWFCFVNPQRLSTIFSFYLRLKLWLWRFRPIRVYEYSLYQGNKLFLFNSIHCANLPAIVMGPAGKCVEGPFGQVSSNITYLIFAFVCQTSELNYQRSKFSQNDQCSGHSKIWSPIVYFLQLPRRESYGPRQLRQESKQYCE